MKHLIEQNEDGGKRRNAAKKKELEAAEKRIAELSAIFKRLYEDSRMPLYISASIAASTAMSATVGRMRLAVYLPLNSFLCHTAFSP